MAIEFICPTCQQQLRVPDTAAGKNAKCPKCASILAVPAGKEEVSPLAPPPQAGFNFAPLPSKPTAPLPPTPAPKTRFAPASSHPSLSSSPGGNPFAADPGQLPANQAMISPAGKPLVSGSQPAMASEPNNPYASPTHAYAAGLSPNVRVEVTPIVNHAIKVWQDNLWLMLATTLIPFVIFFPLIGLMFGVLVLASAVRQPALFVLAMIGFNVMFILPQVYFGAGRMHVCMLIARGQPASVSDLFIGLDRFLPALGYILLVIAVTLMTLPLLYIPLIFLLLIYWPSHYLVIDRKCGVLESFNLAQRIAEGNKLTAFLLVLVGSGFTTLGQMACLVGLFFAIPLVTLMWCTAYLMMSGQLPVPPRPRPYPYPPQSPPVPPAGYLPAAGK